MFIVEHVFSVFINDLRVLPGKKFFMKNKIVSQFTANGCFWFGKGDHLPVDDKEHAGLGY